ncbi:hypothetical protein C8R48DRAFT_706629 [Suillus tomentosus]|nr:hypothetical protein C8R48DRAFT_706629 [Suillus tomentosus]
MLMSTILIDLAESLLVLDVTNYLRSLHHDLPLLNTSETLSRMCANLRQHNVVKVVETGKSTCRRHAYMHTRENVETAQNLEISFA